MSMFDGVRLRAEDNARFEEIASTWNVLQNHISSLDEDTLLKLLLWELEGNRRMYFVNRIKARHNRLRDARERSEMVR
jgi:hypothetical protein